MVVCLQAQNSLSMDVAVSSSTLLPLQPSTSFHKVEVPVDPALRPVETSIYSKMPPLETNIYSKNQHYDLPEQVEQQPSYISEEAHHLQKTVPCSTAEALVHTPVVRIGGAPALVHAPVVQIRGVSEIVDSASSRKLQNNDCNDDVVDSSTLWYSRLDYEQFKVAAMVEAKHVVKARSSSKRLIRRAYEQSLISASTTNYGSNAAGNTICNDRWTKGEEEEEMAGHDCCEAVGLEHLLDQSIYRHRKRRRMVLLAAVDKIQKDAHNSQTCCSSCRSTPSGPSQEHTDSPSSWCSCSCSTTNNNFFGKQPQVREERASCTALLLRQACEDITNSSLLFAKYLAIANATLRDDTTLQPQLQ